MELCPFERVSVNFSIKISQKVLYIARSFKLGQLLEDNEY